MTFRKLIFIMTIIIFIATLQISDAQENTIGLILNTDDAFVGYTLFSPIPYYFTYLIDNNGLLINSWESNYKPALSAYLHDTGDLVRIGKVGHLEVFSWEGDLVWSFDFNGPGIRTHHDIEVLPDGNVLLIAREFKTTSEQIANGRDPAIAPDELFAEYIVEVEHDSAGGGQIVWEWYVWDHLIQDFDSTKANYGIVADHPELMDINFINNPNSDWLHLNSLDYNPHFDQIALSFRSTSEIVIIDHSTTTQEAAGHTGGIYGRGGDFLYRWGNPQSYRAGTGSDRRLYSQHDARWVEAGFPGEGNIICFNNGGNRPQGNYSSVDEFTPPVDSLGFYYRAPDSAYGPAELTWTYQAPNPFDFYAGHYSGAHRLPNGNTLICNGESGEFFEVTDSGGTVWSYINPVDSAGPMVQGSTPLFNNVSKVYRYAPDFPGFAGRPMIPGDPIELYPNNISNGIPQNPDNMQISNAYPNPFNASITIGYSLSKKSNVIIRIYNILGQNIDELYYTDKPAGDYQLKWNAKELSSGIYFYRIEIDNYIETRKMLLLK